MVYPTFAFSGSIISFSEAILCIFLCTTQSFRKQRIDNYIVLNLSQSSETFRELKLKSAF